MSRSILLEVEVFLDDVTDNSYHQAKYIVRGYDDVYWLDTQEEVISVINQETKRDYINE